MKSRQVIGFKPEQGFAEEFAKLVNDLGVKKAQLAEQAVLRGLDAAVQEIVANRKNSVRRLEKKNLAKRVMEMVRSTSNRIPGLVCIWCVPKRTAGERARINVNEK